MSEERKTLRAARSRVHYLLDGGGSDFTSSLVHRGLVFLIFVSITAVVLESVPSLATRYESLFLAIELTAIFVFTAEFSLRVWSAPEHAPYADLHPWRARLEFLRTGPALIDLLSVLPFYLAFFIPEEFRVLLVFRLLRFFKLARYSPGMRSLMAALQSERKALMASAVILFGLVLLAAAAMHLVEHDAQPDRFGSIPDAMWWAIVTLTTVGYGDVVPITTAGRVIAGITMLAGLMMLALPVGIIANAFSEEIHRREFVVTWGMLARVPLFASLSASEIAEVMDYLRARTVPAGTIIMHRGDVSDCMFFIAAGEVEIDGPNGQLQLSVGSFFGEMSLTYQTRRNATARATQPSKLLVLESDDLAALMARNQRMAQSIEAAAKAGQ
jgi:voltage-gated potassium channel